MPDSRIVVDAPGDPWTSMPTIEELTRHDIWTLRRRFLERLRPTVRGLRVLEVGSGPAHDCLTFAERGAIITAIDCSMTALTLAGTIYAQRGLPIRTVQADATKLPFRTGSFDLAFNAGVLEHFADDRLRVVIDEMIRVVAVGGEVLAFCPNRYNVFYQTHLRRVREHQYSFERAFTAGGLRRTFRARGLEKVRVGGIHVHPAPNYLLPAWLPKHHRIEPFMRSCFSWLENAAGFDRLKSLIGQDFVVWGTVVR